MIWRFVRAGSGWCLKSSGFWCAVWISEGYSSCSSSLWGSSDSRRGQLWLGGFPRKARCFRTVVFQTVPCLGSCQHSVHAQRSTRWDVGRQRISSSVSNSWNACDLCGFLVAVMEHWEEATGRRSRWLWLTVTEGYSPPCQDVVAATRRMAAHTEQKAVLDYKAQVPPPVTHFLQEGSTS